MVHKFTDWLFPSFNHFKGWVERITHAATKNIAPHLRTVNAGARDCDVVSFMLQKVVLFISIQSISGKSAD